ncbi:MAG TPA: sigma-54 dependent transcriptional regulator [Pyrinomonadaceae bacterium]|jgi:DNA-binding NtrC family response regulator|nr:sigma-54 dependent transcriptional regulator [Pyrinomonadaceae bacterium]
MQFSDSMSVLLTGFPSTSPHLATLMSILQVAEIQVSIETRRTNSSEDRPNASYEHRPSLVIHSVDGLTLDDKDKLFGELPNSFPVKVPIIIAAQNFEAAQIRAMLELGATDFITPPFTAESILPRVWRLVKHNEPDDASRGTLQHKLAMRRLGLVGQSKVFLDEIKKLSLLARCDITVMIGGETGTGKELIARAAHYLSRRSDRPFVPIDCGAIPPELTESELFGHERGAFTGAVTKNPGLVSAADHGTLFLDEVDALSLSVQAKLLRFLQEMEYRPLGSSEIKKADVRVISATNRDLLQRVHANEFRKDLYYRLNVVQLHLPSLRQRREDIILLARHFVEKYVARFNLPARDFSIDAIQKLQAYHWPGNIRELENVIGAAVALCDGSLIGAADLLFAPDQIQTSGSFREAKARLITEFEREYIVCLLSSCDSNVSAAARAAGKNRRAFWELIRKHKIDVREFRSSEKRARLANGHAHGLA